jgi:hypothetical protein
MRQTGAINRDVQFWGSAVAELATAPQQAAKINQSFLYSVTADIVFF